MARTSNLTLAFTALALCSGAVMLSAACSTEVLNPIDEIGADGGGGQAPPLDAAAGGAGGQVPNEPMYTRMTMSGEVTWSVTFDEEAKMAGATDCSYTRRYDGEENLSRPWACTDCEARFRVDVEVIAGLEDCYPQVSNGQPFEEEWLGYGNGPWFRGIGALMGEQGTATRDGDTLTIANTVEDVAAPVGGTLRFDVAGTLTLGEESGDPLAGFRAADSYTCGWPKADPPPYEGDYTLVVGETVPDGWFLDACEETVRLHDFAGDYLVIDMSAIDCPPCQQMASLEEAFVETMADEGVTVHVVTLLAPSLNDTLGTTTTTQLEGWIGGYGLLAPVLADRGWGLSIFAPAIGDETGYPSWVVVNRDLEVVEFATGFSGWNYIASVIRSDAAN